MIYTFFSEISRQHLVAVEVGKVMTFLTWTHIDWCFKETNPTLYHDYLKQVGDKRGKHKSFKKQFPIRPSPKVARVRSTGPSSFNRPGVAGADLQTAL